MNILFEVIAGMILGAMAIPLMIAAFLLSTAVIISVFAGIIYGASWLHYKIFK